MFHAPQGVQKAPHSGLIPFWHDCPLRESTHMSNVTKLHIQGAQACPLRHSGNRVLLDHWQDLRKDNAAPDKRQLNLRLLSALLPMIGLIAHDPRTNALVWRLAGSGLCRLWGHELTGAPAFENWPQFERMTLLRVTGAALRTAQPFVARLKLLDAGYGPDLEAECLGLPLKDNRTPMALISMPLFRSQAEISLHHPGGVELQSLRILSPAVAQPEPAAPLPGHVHGPLRVIPGGRK